MSKHHNNYTNYNKFHPADVEPIVREVLEAPVEVEECQVELELEPEVEEKVESVVEEPTKAEPKTGIVTANKLNIRRLPVVGAEVLTVVDQNTALMVDPDYETVEWIKVYTPAGLEGYCMKKFVTVK